MHHYRRSVHSIPMIILALGLCGFTGINSEPVPNEHFGFTMVEPSVIIDIPELPQMQLERHPLADSLKHMRFKGSAEGYELSILTPTADEGMSSVECASSLTNSIVRREGLNEGSYRLYASEDKSTYGMFYGIRIYGGNIRLDAHLFSAAGGTHCIDVHISKVTNDMNEAKAWLRGMRKARIRTP